MSFVAAVKLPSGNSPRLKDEIYLYRPLLRVKAPRGPIFCARKGVGRPSLSEGMGRVSDKDALGLGSC